MAGLYLILGQLLFMVIRHSKASDNFNRKCFFNLVILFYEIYFIR